MEGYARPLNLHLSFPSAETLQQRLHPVTCNLDTLPSGLQPGSLIALPSHREGATRPLLWFICFRMVAHDTQVPRDTWDPEDPMPSFCGWAVSWALAKCRISATACGSLSDLRTSETQLPSIPAAPTVTAEVGPNWSTGVLYSHPRAAAELHTLARFSGGPAGSKSSWLWRL